MISIETPFPPQALPQAWGWLREFPDCNFDDFGPSTLDEFLAEMARRAESEQSWGISKDGELCGIVGYLPITARNGTFHGICFARWSWGRETTMTAVRSIIGSLLGRGVEKISASFFADNSKIYAFFRDLGAVDEGYWKAQTLRQGKPTDMRSVAIFREGC